MGQRIQYQDAANRRKMYRAEVSDLKVRFQGMEGEYYAKDMSATGIGLDYYGDMKTGEPVIMSLYDQGELVVSDVAARVAHSAEGLTGFYYYNLDAEQYDAIYAYAEDILMDDPNYASYESNYYV